MKRLGLAVLPHISQLATLGILSVEERNECARTIQTAMRYDAFYSALTSKLTVKRNQATNERDRKAIDACLNALNTQMG